MSDLSKLKKFENDEYLSSYLDEHVKGSIAYQIRALREKLGLTQAEFGALVGMPQTVISRLESGEGGGVNVNTLLKIAIGLKIGLAVGFCNFETILKSDVSPAALQVETIHETISRLQAAAAPVPTTNTAIATINVVTTIGSGQAWQTEQVPNQPPTHLFNGSGTLSFVRSIPTPALPDYHPTT